MKYNNDAARELPKLHSKIRNCVTAFHDYCDASARRMDKETLKEKAGIYNSAIEKFKGLMDNRDLDELKL